MIPGFSSIFVLFLLFFITIYSLTPFTVRRQGHPWTPRTPIFQRHCFSHSLFKRWPFNTLFYFHPISLIKTWTRFLASLPSHSFLKPSPQDSTHSIDTHLFLFHPKSINVPLSMENDSIKDRNKWTWFYSWPKVGQVGLSFSFSCLFDHPSIMLQYWSAKFTLNRKFNAPDILLATLPAYGIRFLYIWYGIRFPCIPLVTLHNPFKMPPISDAFLSVQTSKSPSYDCESRLSLLWRPSSPLCPLTLDVLLLHYVLQLWMSFLSIMSLLSTLSFNLLMSFKLFMSILEDIHMS